MICEICGTEHDTGIQRFDDNAYQAACRLALSTQLASMTKRAEETGRQLERNERRRERLIFLLNAAEAKLATALAVIRTALACNGWCSGCNSGCDVCNALRALGIDPIKEQKK